MYTEVCRVGKLTSPIQRELEYIRSIKPVALLNRHNFEDSPHSKICFFVVSDIFFRYVATEHVCNSHTQTHYSGFQLKDGPGSSRLDRLMVSKWEHTLLIPTRCVRTD